MLIWNGALFLSHLSLSLALSLSLSLLSLPPLSSFSLNSLFHLAWSHLAASPHSILVHVSSVLCSSLAFSFLQSFPPINSPFSFPCYHLLLIPSFLSVFALPFTSLLSSLFLGFLITPSPICLSFSFSLFCYPLLLPIPTLLSSFLSLLIPFLSVPHFPLSSCDAALLCSPVYRGPSPANSAPPP